MQQCCGCQAVGDHVAKSAAGDAAVTELLSEESWAERVCAAGREGALNSPSGQVQGLCQVLETVGSSSR